MGRALAPHWAKDSSKNNVDQVCYYPAVISLTLRCALLSWMQVCKLWISLTASPTYLASFRLQFPKVWLPTRIEIGWKTLDCYWPDHRLSAHWKYLALLSAMLHQTTIALDSLLSCLKWPIYSFETGWESAIPHPHMVKSQWGRSVSPACLSPSHC